MLAVIAGLLLLGTATVYATGGTGYAFPYVQLIPALVAAARFGVAGGAAVALIGALLLGPFMPLDVARGVDQSTANWLTRALFFVALGGFTGWLFGRVRLELRERDRLAREDRATGLGNGAALDERIEDVLLAAAPDAPPATLYVVRITDFFEALDAVGFNSGDHLAAAVARRIESAIPELGRPYRFSAAELAFVATVIAPDQMPAMAAEIKGAGEQAVNVQGVPVRVELCVGAERTRAEDGQHPHDALRRAHLALFAAEERQQGHAVYDQRYERAHRDVFGLITRVREALDEDQFELFYQPKIRLADGAVTGVEALIRWRHPIHGIVPPARFMPKVERTSLIGPVTRFAFQEACRFADGNPGLSVGVNVSPRSLYDEWLLEELCETIERLNVPASNVEIEITEGVLAHDPVQAASRLERLRAYGMPLSIDDFGTGYSSFAYLHRLPVTGLKIDRSFVAEQDGDPRLMGILRCIVQSGHELGLEVVAEGVETEAQLAAMREIGCDLAQGFLFARPQPAAEFLQWLRARTVRDAEGESVKP